MRYVIDSLRYEGGPQFNQSNPITADHVHRQIHLQVIFLAFAAMFLANAGLSWEYNAIMAAAIWFIEGRGFCLDYHVFPNPPRSCDYSLWTWIVGWVKFW
jgi:hypothetical protein